MELNVVVVIVAVVAVVAVAVAATVAEQLWHVGATVAGSNPPGLFSDSDDTAWLRVVTVMILPCRRPFNAQGDT